MNARVKNFRVGRVSAYVGISRFHELRVTRARGYFEVHVGRVYAGWVRVPAPALSASERVRVEAFGIHPELEAMHDTHDRFHLSDGGLGCKRCHICDCHTPRVAADPCPYWAEGS